MEPITGLLFVLGALWAMRSAGRAVARVTGPRRAAARQRATQRGGTHNREGSARRAARQATAGYWAAETRHGFPTARHGFAQGWREHQQALAERDRDAAAHRADTEGLRARMRAEAAAHHHRMQIAQEQANPPTMTDQLKAAVAAEHDKRGWNLQGTHLLTQTGDPHMGAPAAGCTNPDCSCHTTDSPPLADGQTPGAPPANGQALPAQTNGGKVSDFNLDQIVELADKLTAHADHAVTEGDLDQAPVMADAIGHLVPTDATTNGLAGDVAAAAIKIKEGNAELLDASQALHRRAEDTYRNLQEAKDASGEDLPEPALLDH